VNFSLNSVANAASPNLMAKVCHEERNQCQQSIEIYKSAPFQQGFLQQNRKQSKPMIDQQLRHLGPIGCGDQGRDLQ
jgi:hypothetical protein